MSNEIKYFHPLFASEIPLAEIDALTSEIMSSDPFRMMHGFERLQENTGRIIYKITLRQSSDHIGEIRLLSLGGETICTVIAPTYPEDDSVNEEIRNLLLSGVEIDSPIQLGGGKVTLIPIDKVAFEDQNGITVKDFRVRNHEYEYQLGQLKQAVEIYIDGLKQIIRTIVTGSPEFELTYLEKKIIDVIANLRADQMATTDNNVAARLPLGPGNTSYTREWINKKRNEMRNRGIDV